MYGVSKIYKHLKHQRGLVLFHDWKPQCSAECCFSHASRKWRKCFNLNNKKLIMYSKLKAKMIY